MNGLRHGRKKKPYMILVIVDKNLRDQKVYCKADWKSVHAQETQVNFLKKASGFPEHHLSLRYSIQT